MICSDVGTRYESSVLLWEKFNSMSLETRQWIETATVQTVEISASTDPVDDLLLKIKVKMQWFTNFIMQQFLINFSIIHG